MDSPATQPKAVVVVTVVGVVVVAIRGTGVVIVVVPRATAHHPALLARAPDRTLAHPIPRTLPMIGGLRDKEAAIIWPDFSGDPLRGTRLQTQTPEPEGAFAPRTEPDQIRDHDSE